MTSLRTLFLAISLGLTAIPAAAGGITFDLPRLTFPQPQPDVTRDCAPMTICLPATR